MSRTRWALPTLAVALALAAGARTERGPLGAQAPRPEEVQFKAAQHKEEVEGDLKGAIEAYAKLAQSRDRTIAARALVRMAECYQKLGDAQSRTIYERVVREFADQPEAAAQARARLADLQEGRPSLRGIVTRQVWTGPQVDTLGSISPDGRLLSFVDWDTGDLAIRNLATGDNRRLTNKGSWDQSPEFALFSHISPDGRLIAYNWAKRNFGWDIRVGPVDGSVYRAVLATDAAEDYAHPEDWSPDGRQLVALLATRDVKQIGVITVADGSRRVLKSFDWRSPGRIIFSPDGKYIAYDFPPIETSPERDIYVLAADGSREVHLVEHAADDFLLGWLPDGRVLFASDRAGTTDAWTVPVSDGKSPGAPELLKKDLGNVYSLGLTRASSLYYGLRVAGPDVYTVPLDSQSGTIAATPVRVAQRFIGTNTDPDWSPDGRRLVYVSERGSPPSRVVGQVLCIRDLESGLYRELPIRLGYVSRPRWSPDGRSILFRANDEKGRLSFFVADAETGRTTVLVRRDGLQMARWSRDGQAVFVLTTDYSDVFNKTGQASWIVARNVETGQEQEIFRETSAMPVGDAFVNNLTVSPDGRLLAFTVRRNNVNVVVVVESAGGIAREIFRSSSEFQIPNFGGLAWTPNGREILLVKASGPPQGELWALPAEGGTPRPLGLRMEGFGRVAPHPNGRQIAFQAGARRWEVWALENLQRQVR
jgi:Tol biopolymer transport system component